MSYIYLIGTTGAAKTPDEDMAAAFEQASGYTRCTQQEYLQRMRQIQALDLPAQADPPPEPTEIDGTASSTASSALASPPAPTRAVGPSNISQGTYPLRNA